LQSAQYGRSDHPEPVAGATCQQKDLDPATLLKVAAAFCFIAHARSVDFCRIMSGFERRADGPRKSTGNDKSRHIAHPIAIRTRTGLGSKRFLFYVAGAFCRFLSVLVGLWKRLHSPA
jgi:hypothetical protein